MMFGSLPDRHHRCIQSPRPRRAVHERVLQDLPNLLHPENSVPKLREDVNPEEVANDDGREVGGETEPGGWG
jgi:hypothetical protein